MRILILGGTAEALELARLLAADARFQATLSLAGRTSAPRLPPIDSRIGGFGGVEGLVSWLRSHGTEAVIDATHPFADLMSANVVAATAALRLPLGSIVRPAWTRVAGDDWLSVRDAVSAALALGEAPRRVFLTVGRLELPQFAAAPQHLYLARTIEGVDGMVLPPRLELLRDRGPFALADEVALMRHHRIEVVVSKNSGGPATYAKIEAARLLALPVIMIERPAKACGHALDDAADGMRWLGMLAHGHGTSASDRSV